MPYKIPSYNSWMQQTATFSTEFNATRNHIGDLIKKINSPLTFPERLDLLIELRNTCRDFGEKSHSSEVKMVNHIFEQTNGLLSIMLNSKTPLQLETMIDMRLTMRELDIDYIPNSIQNESNKQPDDKNSFKKKQVMSQLLAYTKGNIKLETIDERILRDMQKERAKGKEAYDQYLADLKNYLTNEEAPEHYFSKIEREDFRAVASGGILYKQKLLGAGDDREFSYIPFDTKDKSQSLWQGEVIYALGSQGDMFLYPSMTPSENSPWSKTTHHTTAFSGKGIICGGRIETDSNGMIRHIDNWSGHYQPTLRNLFVAVGMLKEKGLLYKTTEVQFTTGSNNIIDLQIANLQVTYHNTKSAKDDVKNNCLSITSPTNKRINNELNDFLAKIESCNTGEEVCKYTYVKYIGLPSNSPLKKPLEDALVKLLNIDKNSYKDSNEFNTIIIKRMNQLLKYFLPPTQVNTIKSLASFIRENEKNLTGIRSLFVNKKQLASEISFARDACFNLSRGKAVPSFKDKQYDITEKQWEKSPLSKLKFIQIQQKVSQQVKPSNNDTIMLLKNLLKGNRQKTSANKSVQRPENKKQLLPEVPIAAKIPKVNSKDIKTKDSESKPENINPHNNTVANVVIEGDTKRKLTRR